MANCLLGIFTGLPNARIEQSQVEMIMFSPTSSLKLPNTGISHPQRDIFSTPRAKSSTLFFIYLFHLSLLSAFQRVSRCNCPLQNIPPTATDALLLFLISHKEAGEILSEDNCSQDEGKNALSIIVPGKSSVTS